MTAERPPTEPDWQAPPDAKLVWEWNQWYELMGSYEGRWVARCVSRGPTWRAFVSQDRIDAVKYRSGSDAVAAVEGSERLVEVIAWVDQDQARLRAEEEARERGRVRREAAIERGRRR